jgi:hypothetical protein
MQFHYEDTSERFVVPGIETSMKEYLNRHEDKSRALSIWESLYVRCGRCWRGWQNWKKENPINSDDWEPWIEKAEAEIKKNGWS